MSYYEDPYGLLFCNLCQVSWNLCPCDKPLITSDLFFQNDDWESSDDPNLYLPPPEPFAQAPVEHHQFAPGEAHSHHPRSLQPHNLEQFNQNATIVMPSTVEAHVLDSYNAGDKLRLEQSGEPPQQQPRRLPLLPSGYVCKSKGCGEAFDRNCDLNRHVKKRHSKFPHQCPYCTAKPFQYPKDLKRHITAHHDPSSARLYCQVPGCTDIEGFSRPDNRLRHQRKSHAHLFK